MIKEVQDFVNTNIHENFWRRANWSLARGKCSTDPKQVIMDQSMSNVQTRKFIDRFESLSKICLLDDEEREVSNEVGGLYRDIIRMARKKSDFTNQEIDTFSEMCDVFYEKWIDLLGEEGATNYFHMIGAGHLTYYLRQWRNLYRFSQQGWESLNALFKTFYFRRTQRGGHGGKRNERNSKFGPVARWYQRKLFWLSGEKFPDPDAV
jgi:hypothetical protein